MVQCPSCGGSFQPRAGESPVVCPFCSARLAEAEIRPGAPGHGLDAFDEGVQTEDATRVDRLPDSRPPAGKRTIMGSPNPFAHDSISEMPPSGGPAPVTPAPEAGKRTLFGRALPPSTGAAPAPAAPPRPVDDAAEAERRREERERYAAARLAAAAAVQKRRANAARIRGALIALIVLGAAALVVAAVVLFTRGEFTAELAGELSVVREGEAYQVKVLVGASDPATVTHPGGQAKIEKRPVPIEFSVPERDLAVGDNQIELTVTAKDQPPVKLELTVTVYYRLKSGAQGAPREGRPVEAQLSLMDGWTAEVRGGEVKPAGPGNYVVSLDPDPLLDRVDSLKTPTGELPVALTLRGPDGKVQAFTERLELPLPATPLTVWSPPPGRKTTAAEIPIAGRTSPGAAVSAGGAYGRANGKGVFSLTVPAPEVGPRSVTVRADGRRRVPTEIQVEFERVDRSAWKAAAKATRRAADEWLGRAKRPPRWRDLVRKADALRGRKVKLKGKAIAIRRSKSGGVEVQIDTCRGRKACPVWANFGAITVLSSAGERVTVYGTLDGTREYETEAGSAVTVPLIDGRYLVP